jgi:hypothetical protein
MQVRAIGVPVGWYQQGTRSGQLATPGPLPTVPGTISPLASPQTLNGDPGPLLRHTGRYFTVTFSILSPTAIFFDTSRPLVTFPKTAYSSSNWPISQLQM